MKTPLLLKLTYLAASPLMLIGAMSSGLAIFFIVFLFSL